MSDRTKEFFQIIENITSSSSTPLIPFSTQKSQKSQFTRAAAMIAKQINDLVANLQKLTLLSQNKSLFQDKTAEINDLIASIRQEMTHIKTNITKLQQHNSNNVNSVGNKQELLHSSSVLNSLNTKLGEKSTEFTSILKIRSANLKSQQSRKELYTSESTMEISSFQQRKNVSSNVNNHSFGDKADGGDAVIDFGYYEQELAQNNQNSSYMDARDQTIESIEQTIAEIGNIYTQFANVLSQQREMVQRIDDNTLATLENVEGAHGQILKYYENMGGNRGLMLKTFGVVMTFFMVFVLMT